MQTVSTSDLVPSQGKDVLHAIATKYKSKPVIAAFEHLARYAKEKLITPQQEEPKAQPKYKPNDDTAQKYLAAD